MNDLRCQCGKIVCQSDEKHLVIIKCRHCKRYMLIKVGTGEFEVEESFKMPHLNNRRQVASTACAKH